MQRRKFSREFKLEAVKLVRERGVSVSQAARDLDLHENVLRKWVLASTFTAASRMVTGTSWNGWMDWRLRLPGTTAELLADEWRQQSVAV